MNVEKSINISINTTTNAIELEIVDETLWPLLGVNRSQVALAFYCEKISVSGPSTALVVSSSPLTIASGSVSIVYDNTFTNAEKSSCKFLVGADGYHKTYMLPMLTVPSGVDGDIYYDSILGNIMYRSLGSYNVVSFEDLIELQVISSTYITNYPANPHLSIRLDEIAQKYSQGRVGSTDKDFKQWNTLYIMLYGALLNFDKGAYIEYERTIVAANKLA